MICVTSSQIALAGYKVTVKTALAGKPAYLPLSFSLSLSLSLCLSLSLFILYHFSSSLCLFLCSLEMKHAGCERSKKVLQVRLYSYLDAETTRLDERRTAIEAALANLKKRETETEAQLRYEAIRAKINSP